MKIRNGFVSNSSSSSFIISGNENAEEVLSYVETLYKTRTEEQIKQYKEYEGSIDYSNLVSYLEKTLSKDFVDKNILVETVEQYQKHWADLEEYFSEEECFNPANLVLYDLEDNMLNWLDEEIENKFCVIDRCLHM